MPRNSRRAGPPTSTRHNSSTCAPRSCASPPHASLRVGARLADSFVHTYSKLPHDFAARAGPPAGDALLKLRIWVRFREFHPSDIGTDRHPAVWPWAVDDLSQHPSSFLACHRQAGGGHPSRYPPGGLDPEGFGYTAAAFACFAASTLAMRPARTSGVATGSGTATGVRVVPATFDWIRPMTASR